MQLKKEKIKEYLWVIRIVIGILLILGILTPISYISVGSIYDIIWIWGMIYTNSSGNPKFDLITNSDVINSMENGWILLIAGAGYAILLLLIAFIYLINGFRKKEVVKEKSKRYRMDMEGVGFLAFIPIIGLLIIQGTTYEGGIVIPHLGAYSIIISSLLLFLGAYVTHEKKEYPVSPVSDKEESLEEQKVKPSTVFDIVIFSILHSFVIAFGVFLVWICIFLWNYFHLPWDFMILINPLLLMAAVVVIVFICIGIFFIGYGLVKIIKNIITRKPTL